MKKYDNYGVSPCPRNENQMIWTNRHKPAAPDSQIWSMKHRKILSLC